MAKDMTNTQADQWVVQELAKHPTLDSVRQRLEVEERTVQMIEQHGLAKGMPNSLRAHKDLIVALREALQ